MSITEHIVLYLILFITFIGWSKYTPILNKKSSFWIFASIPIVFYMLIVGSRYGWGPDYLFYKYRLERALTYPEEQLGFKFLNQLIYKLGFNYVGGYMVYSLIFVLCAFILIRSYGAASKYMYAFLIPVSLQFVTSAIRQGVALSFILLFVLFINKKKWTQAFICFLLGYSIHSSVLITAALILGFYFLTDKPINWRISVPLYIICTFLFDGAVLGNYLAAFLKQYVVLDNKFQSYIDDADSWFSADASNDIYTQSTFALIMSSLYYIVYMILGFFSLDKIGNKRIVYIFNSTVFGIIFYRVFFFFEILRRIAEPLIMLSFIVLGYTLLCYTVVAKKTSIRERLSIKKMEVNTMYKIGFIVIYFYQILFWGRFVFLNPTAFFFWNK